MDILEKTIQSLYKKEIINYKLYTYRSVRDGSRKDVELFDFLKKTDKKDVNKDKIIAALYPETGNMNTYNKLKTRLLEEIDNSLVQFYFHETDIHFIYSELSLHHTFSSRNELDVAHYHLKKAEKKALQSNSYLLLDIIYTEFVSLSTRYNIISPEGYIEKRNVNTVKLQEMRRLDDVLASIVSELNRNQNFGKANTKTITRLNQIIRQVEQKKEFKNNVFFKSKLYSAISQVLISKKDFATLESLSIQTYHDFLNRNYFTKGNHDVKLKVLRYICNSLFMNKKHHEALHYIAVFYTAMKEYKGFLYDTSVFFYYNALANNYSVLNTQKAIEVLTEAKNIPGIINHPNYLGYVYLNLAGAYFDLKQPKLAIKNIVKIYHHPVFETLDNSFKLQIYIIDVLLRIESQSLDFAEKQLDVLFKKHKRTLLSKEHLYDLEFMSLIKKLVKQDFEKNKTSLKLVSAFLENDQVNGASNIVDYGLWLKERFLA